ncbi:phytase-like protein with esterase activity [Stackebrandtia albiflava]|uniref:Phytase-like protein with esterase activity n=1 Tax=Stackebrandtia albiflava TaxID=406432 RepID=A0A562VDE4_9ACTN|nr:phytase-like protein with esterase activity [Stackebrandtia albiflava]
MSAGLTGLAALSLMTPLAAPAHAETPDDAGFHRLATFPVYLNGSPDEVTAAEIAAVTEDGETVVYTDSPAGALGFVDITDPAAPQPAGRFTLDGEPTSVAVAGGRILAAVNTGTAHAHPDGELAVFDAATREPVATVALGGQPDSIAVDPSHRWAAIAIENERDEDVADGALPQAPAGRLAVVDLHDLTVTDVDLTGLAEVAPDDPEPEYVSVNADGVAVVTLQENNHIALVDLATATVVGDFSAGSTRVSGVDVADDGRIELTGTVDAVREPDSVAWIGTEFIATANEGDWRGGTRGWTVFDTRGEVVHDSGNGFEYLGISHGLYPDKRSDSAGTEPEGLTVGTFHGVPHLFVASERGNFIAVYDVTDPASPRFRQLLPTGNEPEGLVTVPERDLLVVANELDEAESGIRSTVQIYRMDTGTPVFPSIVSDTVDGVPLGWGALSGLSASPTDPDALYAVTDSAFAHTRLLDVDVSTSPARITGATEVTRDGSPVGYDAEGVFARPDGGFWLASEGSPEDGVPNLLVRLNAEAEVVEEIPLPEDVAADVTGRGLEGVTAFGSGDDEVVWVALQSPLSGGEDALLGRYEVSTGAWSWAGYALESATGDAATGLSEITATGPDTVAVIERDGAGGPDATVKRIHVIDLSEVRTGTADQAPRVDAQEAVDVLPVLRRGAGWTPDKLEGLAVAGNGRVYVVTDNDFVDDATGETVFADLGDATALFGTGGDGDLPVTGNSLTTLVVSAVLLVAVGSVALLILRRRALSRW